MIHRLKETTSMTVSLSQTVLKEKIKCLRYEAERKMCVFYDIN